jgi:hypothetical protein
MKFRVTCTRKGCYMEVRVTTSHSFIHRSWDLINLCQFLEGPFSTFSLLWTQPNPPGLKFWRSCLFVMFLLGIFSGVFLCVVGLRLCLYHHFWIIDSRWSTNHFVGREGPLVFLLKAWSHLLEGMWVFIPLVFQSQCVRLFQTCEQSHKG